MDEKTFFEYDDVKVTNARFISGSQNYAMSNVTSAKAFEEKPSRLWGIVALLIGLAIAYRWSNHCGSRSVLPIPAEDRLSRHALYCGGETSALKTYQREYLSKVLSALNEAIVHRG